jgi:hypothetical protein
MQQPPRAAFLSPFVYAGLFARFLFPLNNVLSTRLIFLSLISRCFEAKTKETFAEMSSVFAQLSLRSLSTSSKALRIPSGASHEITFPIAGKKPVVTSLENACDAIKSGDHIFVQGIAATPTPLLEALCGHVKRNNLNKITLHHLHLEGPTPWTAPDVKG